MKKLHITILLAMLFFPALASAQKAKSDAAAMRWPGFWQQFSAAINKKDRVALRRMMASDFFDGGGGGTASNWIKFMDQQNLWQEHQRSAALGTKPYKIEGKPGRVTKNDHLIFEFKGGRWRWWGIMGD